ncbi:MAG: hypothetical protein JO266_18305 [Acidobacteria bacterium]|nr:hypothetical protein [Acidobacteriota bacterium]MBV9479640.1 hypothetical protein [Acidobacteriota bacterium]
MISTVASIRRLVVAPICIIISSATIGAAPFRLFPHIGKQPLIGFVQGQQPIPLLAEVFDLVACITKPSLGAFEAGAQLA